MIQFNEIFQVNDFGSIGNQIHIENLDFFFENLDT